MTGNTRKGKRAWIKFVALIATAALIAASFAGAALAVDLDTPCSLTITIPAEFSEDLNEHESELIVDLYRVAAAVPTGGADTYSLEVSEEFASLAEQIDQASDRETWEASAQAALGVIAAAEGPAPVYTGTVGTAVSDITAGLYLVLTHGDLEDYIYNEEGQPLAGISRTAGYEYHFAPQLIALPSKEAEDGTFNTADEGEWIFDASMMLKPERSERNSSIRVNKTLVNHASTYTATFVFDVEAVLDGVNVYSNVFTLNFDADGTKGFTVDELPVGAEVTVTEVYSGSSYTLSAGYDQVQTGTVTVDEAVFTFQNEHNGNSNGGSGILNTFTYDGEQWNWDPDYNSDSSN